MTRSRKAILLLLCGLVVGVAVAAGIFLQRGLPAAGGVTGSARVQIDSLPCGERLSYALMWGEVRAGRITLSLDEATPTDPPETAQAKLTVASGETLDAVFMVRDTVESWFAPATAATIRFRRKVREGTFKVYRADETLVYDPGAGRMRRATEGEQDRVEPRESPGPVVHDPLSLLYAFRLEPLAPGEVREVRVATRKSVSTVEVRAGEPQQRLVEGLGTFAAMPVTLHPVAGAKKLELFLKEGDLRLWVEQSTSTPLIIEVTGVPVVGTVRAVLRDARGSPLANRRVAPAAPPEKD